MTSKWCNYSYILFLHFVNLYFHQTLLLTLISPQVEGTPGLVMEDSLLECRHDCLMRFNSSYNK